jgi:peptidylprolyl isomerase
MKKLLSISVALLFVSLSSCANNKHGNETSPTEKSENKIDLADGIYANINTDKGDILIQLEYEKTPMTVANFVGLSEGDFTNGDKVFTVPFYDGLKFHRVIPNFMVQGGDPLGTGSGDPGYKFADEFDPTLVHDKPGILSMANSGPATNGSQFFITHKETPWLNNKHTVFGHVIEGQNVVDSIVGNDIMKKVTIIRVGKKAEKFNATEVFASVGAKALAIAKAKAEEVAKFAAMTQAEKNAWFKAKMIKTYPKAKQTESGLMYLIEAKGEGENPGFGNNVSVHYTGYFTDGNKFDSSVDRGTPFQFPLGQKRVIAGWDEGVAMMSKGSKYKLILPYWLGYGEHARGPIPASSTLIFDVELLEF